jgi:hypothetical protein
MLKELDQEGLNDQLKMLSKKTLVYIMNHLDIEVMQKLREIANIKDPRAYFSALSSSKKNEPNVMIEVGKAKYSRKTYLNKSLNAPTVSQAEDKSHQDEQSSKKQPKRP